MFRRRSRIPAPPPPPPLDPRLGIRSVSFPTFGWTKVLDQPDERSWAPADEAASLSVHFFPIPPGLPSLVPSELEPMFGTRRLDDNSAPHRIGLEVDRDRVLPIITVFTRVHVAEHERFAFHGVLIAPLAQCSWVVRLACLEGDPTGVRETLAFDEYARKHPERIGEAAFGPDTGFDPYTRAWDDPVPDSLDPLSFVRRHIDEIKSALEFGPEVAGQPPFAGSAA